MKLKVEHRLKKLPIFGAMVSSTDLFTPVLPVIVKRDHLLKHVPSKAVQFLWGAVVGNWRTISSLNKGAPIPAVPFNPQTWYIVLKAQVDTFLISKAMKGLGRQKCEIVVINRSAELGQWFEWTIPDLSSYVHMSLTLLFWNIRVGKISLRLNYISGSSKSSTFGR